MTSGQSPNRRNSRDFPEGRAQALCDDSPVKRRVLIVDDHAGFRSLARALLEMDGFEVVGEAADAAGTLPAVAQSRPDIVLLDVQLPDGSGLDLAAEIARDGAAVVLVSSHDAADFGARIQSSGARGFIPKSRLSGAAVSALVP